MVRDARRCRAPHHEGPRPHPEERAVARVSKDEATELENAMVRRKEERAAIRSLPPRYGAPPPNWELPVPLNEVGPAGSPFGIL
jgi:hypothetical protein